MKKNENFLRAVDKSRPVSVVWIVCGALVGILVETLHAFVLAHSSTKHLVFWVHRCAKFAHSMQKCSVRSQNRPTDKRAAIDASHLQTNPMLVT